MPGIVFYLETEFFEIETSAERMDLNFKLEDKLDADQNLKNNLAALTIVLCDKFLSSENMIELWRDRKMVKLINKAELSKIEDLSGKIVTTNSAEELIDFLKH